MVTQKITQKKVDKLVSRVSEIKYKCMKVNEADAQVIKEYLSGDIEYHVFAEHFDSKVTN